MGFLVRYKFEDITIEEIALLGEGLDTIPYGRVAKFIAKIQAQITEQEMNAAIQPEWLEPVAVTHQEE